MEKSLLIFYTIILVLYITNDFILNRRKNQLMEEILNFNKVLLEEKRNILEIIRNADETKEVWSVTLDKIKKELLYE